MLELKLKAGARPVSELEETQAQVIQFPCGMGQETQVTEMKWLPQCHTQLVSDLSANSNFSLLFRKFNALGRKLIQENFTSFYKIYYKFDF